MVANHALFRVVPRTLNGRRCLLEGPPDAAPYAWQQSLGLSLVIGLAMIVNMAAAAVSGASIPLILNAMGKDPAQSSSIFMTTVTDIVGFASFLGFAMAFSSWLT